jgi:hypothetical protein
MMMHPQETRHELLMHWGFGLLLLVAVIFRVTNRLVEWSILGCLAGMAFTFAAPEMVGIRRRAAKSTVYMTLCLRDCVVVGV